MAFISAAVVKSEKNEVMLKLNYDITRRTEDARKSRRRAEIRLEKQFNEAGGIEDEMKYNLSRLKRQRKDLERELQGLKFEAKQYAKASEKNNEMSPHAGPNIGLYSNFAFASLAQRSRSASVKKSDYGKNFFGYHSAPGSHKKLTKTTNKIDYSTDKHFHKIDQIMQEERTQQQRQQQQKLNENVQDKLENWKTNNPIKKTNRNIKAQKKKPVPKQDQDADIHEKSALTKFDNEERSNQTINPFLQHESSGFFFDADIYAPDGRIRMVHRMPEFSLAFDVARRTRYVRTKEKRDFEIPLSVNQMLH